MKTWQDVINTADATFRNTFSTGLKVNWLRSILNQVLQLKYSRDVTFAFFDVFEGIRDYDLPVDCEPDDIVALQIETSPGSQVFKDFYYQDVFELKEDPFYTITNGMIHFGSTPTEDKLGLIFYVGTPDIDGDKLDEMVPIPMAYRELLVHGLCERMAAARGDVARKNNFKSDFDSLLSDFLMSQLNNVPEYYTPRDVYNGRRRGRRRW